MAIFKIFKKKPQRRVKVGLCLSGGGTRGFAHLGAFKAFEECGIKFDMVAGTSTGSLFGALYATGESFEEINNRIERVKDKAFKKQKLGIFPSSMDSLNEIIKEIMPVKKIEELSIPYFAVAVDLKTGMEVDFSEGNLASVITGSCAIPWIFKPVKYRGMNLIDGGVKNNIPADVLLNHGCDIVITIDCNSGRGGGTNSEKSWKQFITSIGIMMVNNSQKGLKLSNFVISPNMERFNSLKIVEKDAMIEEGYNSAMAAMLQIKRILHLHR